MERLRNTLRRIDGRGYKAYKDIRGEYDAGSWVLSVDHVQGDPFADPSRVSVRVPLAETWLEAGMHSDKPGRVGLCDYVTRAFSKAIRSNTRQRRGTGKSGLVAIDRPGQEMLERSSCLVGGGEVEVRFRMGLPAAGRRVLAREAQAMFFDELPKVLAASLLEPRGHAATAWKHVECARDAGVLRSSLGELGLVAFVAENSILPRRSGIDQRPMTEGAEPFTPIPETLKVAVDLPHAGRVVGLGVPCGVTLIVGGGYHGKSTLLAALAAGVYDHVPGDGRELVVTDPGAIAIRSEDGRRVEKVDISPFVSNLPYGKPTAAFSTEDASGSTSQAANIVEAMEAGANTLIIDEDTSANNFMIRDHRMQLLVVREQEPIIPFIDRVQEIYRERGISTVLVLGGSGDYFDVADQVIQMHEYRPRDVTAEAAGIVAKHPSQRSRDVPTALADPAPRVPRRSSFDPSRGRRAEKVKSLSTRAIVFGEEEIDISLVEQLVDPSQTRFVADLMLHIHRTYIDGARSLAQSVALAFADFERAGFDGIGRGGKNGDRATARAHEVCAAINRLRTLRMK